MKNVKIYLVRHGQDKDNARGILNGRRDQPLTALGRKQAEQAAKKLNPHNIKVIYSSPYRRALTTAKIIAKRLGSGNIVVVDDLKERDFGILTGKPTKDIPKYATRLIKTDAVNYFLDVPGSESFPDLRKRAKKVLDKIRKQDISGNILIVTHGDMGKMVRAAYYGWNYKTGLKTPYFNNTDVLELK